MTDYAILFALVLAVNLLPAFGPPTWSIIALYGFSTDLPLIGLVGTAAVAAASGRLLLAFGIRALGGLLPERRRANLQAARTLLTARRSTFWWGLGLFAVSPLPSGQLFVGAGLMRAPLLSFIAAFFSGRIIAYALYGFAARTARGSTAGELIRTHLSDPLWIGLELFALMLLLALFRIDWSAILGDSARRGSKRQTGNRG